MRGGSTRERAESWRAWIAASRRREFLLVTAAALVVVTALASRTVPLTERASEFSQPWDHHKYLWMATHDPFGFHVAPFCWRVATPLIVKALPFAATTAFALATFVALWFTGVAVYFLARKSAFSRATALSGMLLFFFFGWAVRANLYNIYKPDPLAFLAMTVAMILIVDRRDLWLAALLAVGVMAKESVLFVVPLYYTLHAKKPVDGRLAARTLLVALPAVAVLVALRALIPMRNDDAAYLERLPEVLQVVQLGTSRYELGWLWREIGLARLRESFTASLYDGTIGTWGVVALTLPLFALRRTLPLFARFLPFLALVYAQTLFATNVGRLVIAGFPAVVLMSLHGADAIAGRLRVSAAWFAGLFAALIALSLVRRSMIVLPPRYEALAFLLFLTALFSYVAWRGRRAPA